MGPKSPLSPEQKLTELLVALQRAPAHEKGKPKNPERQRVECELALWMEQHIRDNLKAIMLKVFGAQVQDDTSLRFTSLWNDVIAKVLDNGMHKLDRATTVRQMTTFYSVALKHLALDYIKRRKTGQEIVEHAIRPLVESRERHLWDKHKLDYEAVLEAADRWNAAKDRRGEILRHFYVEGLSYDEIGEQMQLSRDQVKRLKHEALQQLKALAAVAAGNEGTVSS